MDQPCSPEEYWDPDLARQGDNNDIDMTHDPSGVPDHLPFLEAQPKELRQGRFVEMFTGCAEFFPGGKTFMDVFREDQYTEQRQENLYFPWASKEEWAFVSWLLCSRLSMAAIDSLLYLDIIKNASLSFRSTKELRTHCLLLWWRCGIHS
ncbi:hypothetical protein PAXINDRAFT_13271 [Paxillus involutus ATCC 200175]|uniref:Uncharacterized protein n=1 Tax=Paxillus involutus ATCC 200175 TaxID=664439 RepID=A0A0C9TUM4_PAXIN|nr:hypothetical protein PAXINDRAFT_13271 [Paxillus involutus ATCC 200175]